jgi:hypothetical protein
VTYRPLRSTTTGRGDAVVRVVLTTEVVVVAAPGIVEVVASGSGALMFGGGPSGACGSAAGAAVRRWTPCFRRGEAKVAASRRRTATMK